MRIRQVDFSEFSLTTWNAFGHMFSSKYYLTMELFHRINIYNHLSLFAPGHSYKAAPEQIPYFVVDTGTKQIPLVLIRDYFSGKWCVVVPFEAFFYEVHREAVQALSSVFEHYPIDEAVNFCVAEKANFEGVSFEDYIRKHVKRFQKGPTMFFGSRSTEIIWDLVPDSMREQVLMENFSFLLTRNLKFLNANAEKLDKAFPVPSMDGLFHIAPFGLGSANDPYKLIMRGRLPSGKVVALYLGERYGRGVSFQTIATDRSPEYKSMSLVLRTHLAVMREFLKGDHEWDFVDFGVNFEEVAEYKEQLALSHYPLLGRLLFESTQDFIDQYVESTQEVL